MAERLTPRILDQEVRCSSLTCCVVSLSKELYSTLSPFIQVYKLYGYRRYTAGGVTRRWTSIPSIGECNTPWLASWYGSRNMISSGRVGLWLVCTFTLFLPFLCTQSVPRVRKIRAIFFKIFLRWPSFQLSLQKDNTRKTPSKIRDIKLQ